VIPYENATRNAFNTYECIRPHHGYLQARERTLWFMRETVSSICKNKLEKRYNPLPISPSGCQLRHPIAWNGHEPLAIGDVLIASQSMGMMSLIITTYDSYVTLIGVLDYVLI